MTRGTVSGDRLSSRSRRRWDFCTSPAKTSGRSFSKSAWEAGSIPRTWFIRRLSIITSISFDHTRQLGNTLAAIATEKAGICKRGRPAVSGVTEGESREAIRRVASKYRCPLHELGADFWYEAIAPEPPCSRPTTCRCQGPDLADRLGTHELAAAGPAPGAQRRGRAGGPRCPGRGRTQPGSEPR